MSRFRQQGAVLVVSLVLLLIITAIAAATLNSSIFQTSITTNAQTRETTFRVAESAVEQVLPLTAAVTSNARQAQTSSPTTNPGTTVTVTTSQQGMATPTATVRYPGDADGARPAMLAGVQLGGDVGYVVRDYEVTGSGSTSDARIGTAAVLGVAKVETQLGGP